MFHAKSFFPLLATSFFFLSCQLADNTEQLKDITNNMSHTTTVLQRQQRQAVSEQVRTKNLEILQDKDVPFEHRVRSAAIFTKSLEFQVLQDSTEGSDLGPSYVPGSLITKRDQLLAEGIEEYLLVFRGFLVNGRKQHKRFPKVNPFSKDPAHLSALAMALTADQINSEQIIAARHIQDNGFQPQSPLTLIMNTLIATNNMENPSGGMYLNSSTPYHDAIANPYPPPHLDPRSQAHPQSTHIPMAPYMEKVLFYEEESKYLLEARYNMLLGTSMDKLINPKAKSRPGLFGSLMTNNWKADLDNLSAPEIHRTNGYIGEAIHLNQAYNSRYRRRPRLFSRILNVVRGLQFTGDYAERFAGVQDKLFAIDQLRYALSFLRGILNIGKNRGDDYYGDDNYYNNPYNNPYPPYPQPYYNTAYNNGYNNYNRGGGSSGRYLNNRYNNKRDSSELYPNDGYNNQQYYDNGYYNNGYNNRTYQQSGPYHQNNGYNNNPYPQQVRSYQNGNRGYDQEYDYGAW